MALALVYYDSPPPASGFAPLGWAIFLFGILGATSLAAEILAPLAFIFAISAIISIRQDRERLRGTSLALIAMFITLVISGGLITINLNLHREFAKATAARERQDAPRQAQKALEMCYRLLSECRRYADANQGEFPPHSLALKEWIAKDDPGHEFEVEPFQYFGGSLKKSDLGDDEDGPHLLVFISTDPFADGTRVIGLLRGSSRWASDAKIIQDSELPHYISASNRARSNRKMPPIVFPQK